MAAGFVDFFRYLWNWWSSPQTATVAAPIILDDLIFALTREDVADWITPDDVVD